MLVSVVNLHPYSAGAAKVYERTESLFTRLSEEQRKYADWCALGTVDIDDFVDNHLAEAKDYEDSFKLVKTSAKEADRIPMELKVDCYTVRRCRLTSG